MAIDPETENQQNQRKEFLPEKIGELRLYGVGDVTKQELHNIAEWHDTNISALMKPHLRKIIDSYPEKYRSKRDRV